MAIVVAACVSISTPNVQRQDNVARQSPEGRKPLIWLSPSAKLLNISAR
jgi:hypothetical protein